MSDVQLSADEFRALKCLCEENAHDVEDHRLAIIDQLIDKGLARIERHYFKAWGGQTHKVREITITRSGVNAVVGGGFLVTKEGFKEKTE